MSKEYLDRDIKPLREEYRNMPELDPREDLIAQLAAIVEPLING